MVVRHFQRWLLPSEQDSAWLLVRLGLRRDELRVMERVPRIQVSGSRENSK